MGVQCILKVALCGSMLSLLDYLLKTCFRPDNSGYVKKWHQNGWFSTFGWVNICAVALKLIHRLPLFKRFLKVYNPTLKVCKNKEILVYFSTSFGRISEQTHVQKHSVKVWGRVIGQAISF